MLSCLLVGMMTLISPALATEPTTTPSVSTTYNSDGSITVQTVLPASEAELRTILQDPVRVAKLAPDVVAARVVAMQGNCTEVLTTTRVPGTTMDYRSLRCATANGWKDTLIEGDMMQEFQAEWSLRAVDGGTEVTFRIRTVLDIPVPTTIVRSGMASSVKATMTNLIREVMN